MRVAIFDIGNLLGLFLSICGLAVSVFWNKFKSICKKISSRKLGKCILVIITSLVTIGASYVVVISGFMIAAALKAPNENSTVVVLGCKVNGKNPSLMLSKRLEAAYEYLNENKNAVCIVSGGKGSNEEISEAQCMYNYLTEKGIASDRIIMEDKSTDTNENMKYSVQYISDFSSPVGIATNNFHIFRSKLLAKGQGLTHVSGIASGSDDVLFVNYMVREAIGIVKDFVCGNY